MFFALDLLAKMNKQGEQSFSGSGGESVGNSVFYDSVRASDWRKAEHRFAYGCGMAVEAQPTIKQMPAACLLADLGRAATIYE